MYINQALSIVRSCFYSTVVFIGLECATADDLPKIDGNVQFYSATYPSEFWKKKNPNKTFESARITAKIYIPKGTGPFRAVVFLHSCEGPKSNQKLWGKWFRNKGYVFISPNSFKARGYREVCRNIFRVSQTLRVDDAYGALSYLARLPIVDTNHIVVMGIGHGGETAMDAVSAYRSSYGEYKYESKRANRLGVAFKASIALYPECIFHTPPYTVPMLILIGQLDDWALAESCKRHPETSLRFPIKLKVYPNAHHGFDGQVAEHYPDVRNYNSATGVGASVKVDPYITNLAKDDIEDFLKGIF